MLYNKIEDKFIFEKTTVQLLRGSYKFITVVWPCSERENIPDQGFEKKFREFCNIKLSFLRVSQEREMNLGKQLTTLSGILHEIDLVTESSKVIHLFELKNKSYLTDKNDIIVFYAKFIDYLCNNPHLSLNEIHLDFLSFNMFEINALGACMGLGIHPISPTIRPLPILIDNAKRIEFELNNGLELPDCYANKYDDFVAKLNRFSSSIKESWLSNRIGFLSETSFLFKKSAVEDVQNLAYELIKLNSMCKDLLFEIKKIKSENEDYKL